MIQRLSSRPDTDSDSDADVEVDTKSLLIATLGVGVGIAIGVESQHIQTAAKSVHFSIVDNRIFENGLDLQVWDLRNCYGRDELKYPGGVCSEILASQVSHPVQRFSSGAERNSASLGPTIPSSGSRKEGGHYPCRPSFNEIPSRTFLRMTALDSRVGGSRVKIGVRNLS